LAAKIKTSSTTRSRRKLLYTFVPALDVFVKIHLFADLFERDVLSYRDREVAVIAALASMEWVEPMLRGHLGIARNLRLSEGEVGIVLRAAGGEWEFLTN
jgi:alkylhydroperoxidase/carboxymuconolactone decarboxylase family protein YurZ